MLELKTGPLYIEELKTYYLHLASCKLFEEISSKRKRRLVKGTKEAKESLEGLIVSYMVKELSYDKLKKLVKGETPFYIHEAKGRFHSKTLGFYIDSTPNSKERYTVKHLRKKRKRAY